MSDVVDREQETDELRRWLESPGPSLGLLYGRRRVGKTYLLRHTWDDVDVFYFLMADETVDQNRRECLEEIKRTYKPDLHVDDYPNWRTLFRLLLSMAEDRPLVVILDEFQNVMGKDKDEDVPSKITAVWEEAENTPINLMLCGSEISMMKSLNEGKGAPLYGRFDWAHRLEPFTYLEASDMMGDRTLREYVRTYSVYGGIPSYLDSIPEEASLKDHVIQNILSPRGRVHLQIETLFEQEQGIRQPGAYHSILSAIASGATTVNEIAQVSGVQGEGNMNARDKLETLEDLFLVDREKNRDAKRGPYRYYITDPAVDFWYRFVQPNRSRLEMEAFDDIWENEISPSLNTYVGKVFERVCRQGYGHFSDDWGLPGIASWGRWEGQDRNQQSIEIDIVAELTDGSMLLGEIKWSSSPVEASLHFDLQNDLERLAESGRGWAGQALQEETSNYIYFSAGGFSDSFQERSNNDEAIHLKTLNDLF